MKCPTFVKDPDEVKDYTIDWSGRLLTGESIATSTWVLPTGSLTEDSSSNSSTGATIWLSGGEAGTTYSVVNRIVTDAVTPRTYEQAFKLQVTNSEDC